MDISASLEPNSQQLDAIELADGPRTFTVERVSAGNAEQPVNVHLVDFPRPWRPSKNMRRVLAACWGRDASQWAGKRVRLFFDPEVRFGKEKPGGTRISHLSHIDKPTQVPVLVSQGRGGLFTVQPLVEDAAPAAATVTEADVNASTDQAQLRDWWQHHPNLRDTIKARVDQLNANAGGE